MASRKILWIAIPLAVMVAGVGFWAGRSGGDASAPQPQTATPAAGPAEAWRSGKTVAPPELDFAHFRVGNRNVKNLFMDVRNLWLGTSGGLIRYDVSGGDFAVHDNSNGLLSNGIFHVSRLGRELMVGTYGGGLSIQASDGTWRNVNIPQGLADAFVYDLLRTPDGDVWIATWSGANRVRGGEFQRRENWSVYTVANTHGGLPNDWVYGLKLGRQGELWLATEGGLARFREERWDHWNHKDGLGADYEKVKRDISYATDPAQVSEHHARQKREMDLQQVDVAYNPNYVVAIAVDRDGAVWAGTWGGGLSRFDGQRWSTYTVADGLPGNHVFALHIDQAGELWIGTNDGLAHRQGNQFRVLRKEQGLFANAVFAIASGADGSLWVGGYGGVAHLRRPR